MKEGKRILILCLGILAALASFLLDLPLPEEGKIVIAITVLAAVYWFSEVLPLHVTGLLASFLLILFAGFTPKNIFPHYFDPIVMLLLGGFMLALALQKHGLDKAIATHAIQYFGNKPRNIILGFMLLTAFLSFWVSNTASAAVMIPLVLFILASNKINLKKSNFAKAFILATAYAATIGGLGTLVGSTPNPIAAKYITEAGMQFGFMDWMVYGLPFVAIFLFVIWFVVLTLYKPEISSLTIKKTKLSINPAQKTVISVFVLTVLLWATDSLHGLHSSAIALLSVLALYVLKSVNTEDFKKINWPILSLIGSGIVLGSAFQATGIDAFIASSISGIAVGQSLFVVFFAISIIGVLITMFASNTASAALMIPLTIPLAPILGIPVQALIIVTAIAASLDFTAPMGTPPNAIAYSTGAVSVKEMAKTGLVLSLLASLLLAGFATFIW